MLLIMCTLIQFFVFADINLLWYYPRQLTNTGLLLLWKGRNRPDK